MNRIITVIKIIPKSGTICTLCVFFILNTPLLFVYIKPFSGNIPFARYNEGKIELKGI
jgi:hypothetical protein